jgi:predicted nucleic acid-binding protein
VGQIQVVSLTQGEAALQDILSDSLGAGEREGIAIARERHGTVLSNETRVAHCCRQNQIPCVRLPDILRALWVEDVVSRQEMQVIINDLRVNIINPLQSSPFQRR